MVLAKIEEFEDICMPRLEVDCERSLALTAALVDIARGIVYERVARMLWMERPMPPADLEMTAQRFKVS